jgi:hypothetical protein
MAQTGAAFTFYRTPQESLRTLSIRCELEMEMSPILIRSGESVDRYEGGVLTMIST